MLYFAYTITNSVILYVTIRIHYTRKIRETGLPDGGSSTILPINGLTNEDLMGQSVLLSVIVLVARRYLLARPP